MKDFIGVFLIVAGSFLLYYFIFRVLGTINPFVIALLGIVMAVAIIIFLITRRRKP